MRSYELRLRASGPPRMSNNYGSMMVDKVLALLLSRFQATPSTGMP